METIEIIKKASIRDSSRFDFSVTEVQRNLKGDVISYAGTVTEKETKKSFSMVWNILGKALSNDTGLDLVIKESI